MAEAKSKKDLILEVFNDAPALSNPMIAKLTDSSEGYVRRLLGPLREVMTKKPVIDQKQKRALMKAKESNQRYWNNAKVSQYYFMKNFLPSKEYTFESQIAKDFVESDFASFFLPTEDAFSSSGSGQDFAGTWAQYEYLAERRTGVGHKVTRFPAEDAVREGFKIMDKKTNEVKPLEEIFSSFDKALSLQKWLKDTDFMNVLAQTIYMERVYGISFLVMYFSEDDKAKGVLSKEYNEREEYPKAFEPIPPTVAAPMNEWDTKKLDKDPQKWTIRGGLHDPQEINYTRVRVFMSRPVFSRWYGLSVFEPCWDSMISYYQALIFLLRGFAKWGNMIVKYIIPSEEDLADLYEEHIDLVEDMKMNMTYIGPQGTEIDFANTNLANGLKDLIEIWLEDICAGAGFPVNILMGRVVSAGLSGVGNLVAERYYWNTIKKIQQAFTDDVRAILELAGFDLTDLEIDWNLAITKTDQQRLIDEGLQIENEMMKEQLIQQRVMTDRMISGEAFEQPQQEGQTPSNGGKKELEKSAKSKQDFFEQVRDQQTKVKSMLDHIKQRRAELLKPRDVA